MPPTNQPLPKIEVAWDALPGDAEDYDDFNRANNNTELGVTSETGQPWQQDIEKFGINSNQATLVGWSSVAPQGTYTDWAFPSPGGDGYETLIAPMTPLNDPRPAGYFWSQQFWFINGDGGYIGLQTATNNQTQHYTNQARRGAVFSIWLCLDAWGALWDSGPTGARGSIRGGSAPTLVDSPGGAAFGKALQFNGVKDGLLSMGIDVGQASTTGVSAAFCLEAIVKPDVVNVTQVIAGRPGNPVIYIDSAGKPSGHVKDSGGTLRVITATNAISAGTTHNVALTYDNTTLRLFVDGVSTGTPIAIGALQAPGTTTRFMIGREDSNDGNAGYPFDGTIDEVRLSTTARYTSNYTPATVPFKSDGNTTLLYHMDEVRNAKRFSGEGEGQQCLIPFDWKVGETYKMRVDYSATAPPGKTNTDGDWFRGYIEEANGRQTTIGYIQTPVSFDHFTGGPHTNFTELYTGAPSDKKWFPYATCRFDYMTMDGIGPTSHNNHLSASNPGTSVVLDTENGSVTHHMNIATKTAKSGGFALNTIDATSNGTISCTLSSIQSTSGIAFRCRDAANFWFFMFDAEVNKYILTKRVEGQETFVAGTSVQPANGDVIDIVLAGTDIDIKINGFSRIHVNGESTDDSGPQKLKGTVIGNPRIMQSPWLGFGSAAWFDGVNRGEDSEAISFGSSDSTMVYGNFCLEAKIFPVMPGIDGAPVIGNQYICGRSSGHYGCPQMWIDGATRLLKCTVRDASGGAASLTGTTVIEPYYQYDVAVTYDGITLRLFLNGQVEASGAMAGVELGDTDLQFMVGRSDDPNASSNGGWPFYGAIDAVRLSRTARYISDYTPGQGNNRVINGDGRSGTNQNFSTFVFDGVDKPAGTYGSFKETGLTTIRQTDTFIPVDPENEEYAFSVMAKAGDTGGGNFDPANVQYMGFAPYDADQLLIDPFHYLTVSGSARTTLAVSLNPGATTMTVNSATNWHNGATAHARNFNWWPYVDGQGTSYDPYTYSRNSTANGSGAWGSGGISGNVITLSSPWAGPPLPAGTPVWNSQSGGSYVYNLLSATAVPNAWTSYSSATFTGYGLAGSNFPHGTKYVKGLWLVNWSGTTLPNSFRVANYSVRTAGVVPPESDEDTILIANFEDATDNQSYRRAGLFARGGLSGKWDNFNVALDWTDETDRVRTDAGINTHRGRQRETDHMDAGNCMFTFDNLDRALDPTLTTSPYYGKIKPETLMRFGFDLEGQYHQEFTGFIDGFPMRHALNGDLITPIMSSDGFSLLAQSDLISIYDYEVMKDYPFAWYKLGETSLIDTTAYNYARDFNNPISPPDASLNGLHGEGVSSADSIVPGDRSVGSSGYAGNSLSVTTLPSTASFSTFSGVTIEFWIQTDVNSGITNYVMGQGDINVSVGSPFNPDFYAGFGGVPANVYNYMTLSMRNMVNGPDPGLAGLGTNQFKQKPITDGKPHHVVLRIFDSTLPPTGEYWRNDWIVDGVYQDGTNFVKAGLPNGTVFRIGIGGGLWFNNSDVAIDLDLYNSDPHFKGILSNVIFYQYTLSTERAQAHYEAGRKALQYQTSGQRIYSILDQAEWSRALRSIDTGQSILGPAILDKSEKSLSHITKVTDTERGPGYINKRGKLRFIGRHSLINTDPILTFGDAPGEIPFTEPFSAEYDYKRIVNKAEIKSIYGAIPQKAIDLKSKADYHDQGYSRSDLLMAYDTEALAHAQWMVSHYKDPQLRFNSIITRGCTPEEWAQVFDLDIGAKVTVKHSLRPIPYKDFINTDSVKGYFPLDDVSGTTAVNYAGTGNGTYGGTFTLGKVGPTVNKNYLGTGVTFSGSSPSRVTIPLLTRTITNVTLEGWVHLSSTSKNGAFLKMGSSTTGYGIGVGATDLESSGNRLIGLYENVRWIDSGTNIGTGYHHFALVIDASSKPWIYLDGELVYTDVLNGPIAPATEGYIGGYTAGGGGRWLADSLFHVAFHTTALTAEQIAEHAANTGPRLSVTALIEKIDHKVDANSKLETTFYLSNADIQDYLVLDHPTLGKLDSTNKLAF